ncbi:MAG: DNA/RNA non-specific endonuclease, partial [Acidobacteria bacterium]|nr:DNA/RNA non-specific endonuclease [Acidobacteriota bacterium]
PETRYGMPAADRHLFNRQYIVGYSYLFKQPRWALELIDPETMRMDEADLKRLDNFREDLRVPEKFRATLDDYKGSGFDRGHLISSADRLQRRVVNSETFLMSNISPQAPEMNRRIWRDLESAVRTLARKDIYVEVYAICGPLFNIGDPIDVIGDNSVVVPDAFFKSILAEKAIGRTSRSQLEMWTFAIPNKGTDKELADFLRPTHEIERWAGLALWDRLQGDEAEALKAAASPMWSLEDD